MQRKGSVVYLKNIEVPLIVLSKRVFAGSKAVEEQHAIAEDVCGVSLPSIAPTTRYELLWCLPPTAATCAPLSSATEVIHIRSEFSFIEKGGPWHTTPLAKTLQKAHANSSSPSA